MSTKEAIRFKYLHNQLSTSEKQQFMLQLIDQQNDIATRALFKYFIWNHNEAENVNNMISTIIRKREKIPNEEQQFKLDMIPKPLIGHIASFSYQSDYANLCRSRTNRNIYLGCNTPNMLQHLELYQKHQCLNIKPKFYPSIKHLTYVVNNWMLHGRLLSRRSQPIFNQLFTLKLEGKNVTNAVFHDFLKRDVFNLSNIRSLVCSDFLSAAERMKNFYS